MSTIDSPTSSPAAMDTTVADICEPVPDPDATTAPDKISAYYSLAFPHFTYYLQTLCVTIGRRSVRTGSSSSSDLPQIDVDLGSLKSVSRLHAKIEYEEDNERFVLVILGRNGAWVDGIWSGSGSRVPLGARSQIQIATRIFHFVLPPPPAPEDSPSPSSPTSTTRHPSPSIDITSLSPASSLGSPSPPSHEIQVSKAPAPPKINQSTTKTSGKKRKKPDLDPRPLPDGRPHVTYAQLCYRAITSLDGKATLQDICHWVSENFDWYRDNEGLGWEKSVRHNLSSNRAFIKMERCAGERGKGYYWSIDDKFEHTFKEQDAKIASMNGGKESTKGKGKPKNRKESTTPLDPPLKRSVRGETKSRLIPPLTSTPLPAFTTTPLNSIEILKPPPVASTSTPAPSTASADVNTKSEPLTPPLSATAAQPVQTPAPPQQQPRTIETSSTSQSITNASAALPTIPPDMIVPIVIGPMPSPPIDATSSATTTNTTGATSPHLTTPPIALRGNTIILNPTIFAGLTAEQLKELEALGARKAIDILQGYIVRFLKERIKTEGARGRGRGKARTKRGRGVAGARGRDADGDASTGGMDAGQDAVPSPHTKPKSKIDTSSGPFTTLPLPPRQAQPIQRQQQQQSVHGCYPATSPTPTLTSSSTPTAHYPATCVPVTTNADMKPPVPVRVLSPSPMSQLPSPAYTPTPSAGTIEHEAEHEGPAMKRQRLEGPEVNG